MAALFTLVSTRAAAVPSFAVQTGQSCNMCHVGGLGPQLTPFGRNFKMGGYTLRAVRFNVPLAAFIEASFVHTQKDAAVVPATHYGVNDNATIDQVSLFLAGGLGSHLGAFIQNTYDGVGRSFSWDNLDLRAVTTLRTARGTPVVLGLSVNNNPTVQDSFNTLSAWGFPYATSSLAPTPGAGPVVGALKQNTLGITGYAWINSQFYAEFGGYRSLGAGFLRHAGIDPFSPGKIDGVAPYARVAFQKNYGEKNFEVGAYFLNARLFPGRDESTAMSDLYTDAGLDASFQYFAPNHDVVTLNGLYTYERQRLNASRALGLASHASASLQDLRADASYYWRNKIGATVQLFRIWGTADDLLYAANRTRRPDSSGIMLQLDGTPFGDGKSPLGPRFNLRVGVQYTAYFTFNGAARDFDGLGANASDNDTFRVFTWIYY